MGNLWKCKTTKALCYNRRPAEAIIRVKIVMSLFTH